MRPPPVTSLIHGICVSLRIVLDPQRNDYVLLREPTWYVCDGVRVWSEYPGLFTDEIRAVWIGVVVQFAVQSEVTEVLPDPRM